MIKDGIISPDVADALSLTFYDADGTSTKAKVFIKANALQVLSGENPVDFEQYPTVMLTTYSKNIADNYSTMFTINSIQN